MNEVFGPEGLIANAHPDYEYRPGQIQMAQAVMRAFDERHHLIVEAGTGTGKTLAYLVPAVAAALGGNGRVIVSTGTKNLQEQLMEKDIPFLQSILPKKFGAIAGLGFADPTRDFVKLIDLFQAGEHGHALGALDAMQTRVVVATLHDRRAKWFRQNVVQKRNVFVDQLLLEILRAGRDDYARAAATRRRDCGHQISERLAGAGAGFNDQMMFLLKRAQHRLSHFDLAGPVLVFRMSITD